MSKVLFPCCDCCGDRQHSIGHVEGCNVHQRALIAERKKRKKAT